ncbi:MAG: SufE family protein [Verrucomicrobiales bacterium]|nr:SufE family protein [Verrucomicrobiales bacterium]
MSLAEKQQQLIDDYQIIEDPVERFSAIVGLGKNSKGFPESARVDENLVPGCTSRVWLIGEVDDQNRAHFQLDAEAPGIKGVATLLCSLYSGEPVEEIASVEPEFVSALRIDRNLTTTRLNGLHHIRKRMLEIAGVPSNAP